MDLEKHLKQGADPYNRWQTYHPQRRQILFCSAHCKGQELGPTIAASLFFQSLLLRNWQSGFFKKLFIIYVFIFTFWLYLVACGVLVPQVGLESVPLVVGAPSLKRWITRNVPDNQDFYVQPPDFSKLTAKSSYFIF